MSNTKHWDALKAVPLDALKTIGFGKLKGKSDINPQWRYEAMTKEFGVCGIGWKYEITKTWTQEMADGQLMLFVEINLYIKDGEQWSNGIPAIGGDFVIEKDKNGIHGNDEAYKMATTDALGAAMKMVGVAADIYRGLANDSKYGREKPEPVPQQQPQPTAQQFGFPQYETEILQCYTAAGWDVNGLVNYLQQRFQRPPAQLTVEECHLLYTEFYGYAQKKQGGQQ